MTIVHQIWAIYWSLPLTILVSLVAITSKLILVEFKRYSRSSIQHYNTWQHYPLWTLHTTHITTLPNVNTAYYPLWTLHTTHCEHCILPIMNTAYYPLWTLHTTHCKHCILPIWTLHTVHMTTLPNENTAYYPLWTVFAYWFKLHGWNWWDLLLFLIHNIEINDLLKSISNHEKF